MVWYGALGLAVVVIFGIILLAFRKPMNPYAKENQPDTAPPRGTPERRWWRIRARTGRPGSPLDPE